MEGNDRIRFCNACQLNVYNFSEMTEREVRQLIQSHEGRRLCGRLYRRKDGTILTRNCPVGLRAVVRRLSRVAGAILSFMTPGFAAAQTQSYVRNNISSAGVEVYAVDPSGAVISGAEVTLTQIGSNKPIHGKTDCRGRLRLLHYSGGDYTLKISYPGFNTYEHHVELRKGDILSVQTILSVGTVMGEIVDVQPSGRLIDPSPTVSYTFSNQEFKAGSVR